MQPMCWKYLLCTIQELWFSDSWSCALTTKEAWKSPTGFSSPTHAYLNTTASCWDQARSPWKRASEWYQHLAACRQSHFLKQDWEANPEAEAREDFNWSWDCHLESYLPGFMKNLIANAFPSSGGFPPMTCTMSDICLLTVNKNG